jgi:SAM-dependent methyltransferase
MNSQIKQILSLNKKFYQSVSKDFSNSRQYSWKGWERAVGIFHNEYKENTKKLKVLDLGCGNGRFAGYLISKINNFSYKGYDTNNDLLSEARNKYNSGGCNELKFINRDILTKALGTKYKYDFVVSFGVTHHIPDNNFRNNWFLGLTKILNKGGVLVLTFWEFEKSPGDYLISWDKKNKPRYCHQYSKKELREVADMYFKSGFKLLDKYKADSQNTYLIFGKI